MSNTDTYTLPTLADYQAADGATKRSMQAAAKVEMRRALGNDEFPLAKSISQAIDSWVPAKAPKVETDWQNLVALRVANLRHAAYLIEVGETVPAGVPEGFEFSIPEEYVHDEEASVKIANVKVGNSKAAASDLQAAFDEVFADREVGDFLTCQEITNLAGLPSSGAVAARLFAESGCTLTGVTPVAATATTARGAVKS